MDKHGDEDRQIMDKHGDEDRQIMDKHGDEDRQIMDKRGDEDRQIMNKHGDEDRQIMDKHGDEDRQIMSKHGDEDRQIMDKHGDEDRQIMDKHGDEDRQIMDKHGDEDRQIMDKHGDEDRQIMKKHGDEDRQIMSKHGDEDRQIMDKHGDEDRQIMDKHGDEDRQIMDKHGDEDRQIMNKHGDEDRQIMDKCTESTRDCQNMNERGDGSTKDSEIMDTNCDMSSEDRQIMNKNCDVSTEDGQILDKHCDVSPEDRQIMDKHCDVSPEEREILDKNCVSTEEREILGKKCGVSTEERQVMDKSCGLSTEERQVTDKNCGVSTEERQVLDKNRGVSTEEQQVMDKSCGVSTEDRQTIDENCDVSADRQIIDKNSVSTEERGTLDKNCVSTEGRQVMDKNCGVSTEERQVMDKNCVEDKDIVQPQCSTVTGKEKQNTICTDKDPCNSPVVNRTCDVSVEDKNASVPLEENPCKEAAEDKLAAGKGCNDSPEENQVVMQLDLENDAVLITQNDSDSGSESDAKEIGKKISKAKSSVNHLGGQGVVKKKKGEKSHYERDTAMEKFTSDEAVTPACSCKKVCWKVFTKTERQAIYDGFWNLPTLQDRHHWLQAHIGESSELASSSSVRQRCSYKNYRLPLGDSGSTIKVCSTFFRKTIGMTLSELVWCLTLGRQEAEGIKRESDIKSCSGASAEEKFSECDSSLVAAEDDEFLPHEDDDQCEDKDVKPAADRIAALFIEQTFKETLSLVSDLSNQPSSAISVLGSFNKTYPVHAMEASHFNAIFQQVCEKLKNDLQSSQNSTEFLTEASRHDAACISENTESMQVNLTQTATTESESSRRRSTRRKRITVQYHGIEQSPPRVLRLLRKKVSSRGAFAEHRGVKTLEQFKIEQEDPWDQASSDSSYTQKSRRGARGGSRRRKSKLKRRAKKLRVQVPLKNGLPSKRGDSGSKSYRYPCEPHTQDVKGELRVLKYKHKHPMLPACNCSHKGCTTKISDEQRQFIHETFWNLSGVEDRKEWLLKYVERLDPTKGIVSFFQQRKNISKRYFLPDNSGSKVDVCRLFFIHTLGFKWNSVIDHIIRLKDPVKYIPPRERRRTRPLHNLPEHIIDSVKQYVDSIKDSKNILHLETTKTTALEEKHGSSDNGETRLSIKKTPGAKVKAMYLDYRVKYKSLKFNLGYQSFRQICQNALSESQDPNTEVTGDSSQDRGSLSDNDEFLASLDLDEDLQTTDDEILKSSGSQQTPSRKKHCSGKKYVKSGNRKQDTDEGSVNKKPCSTPSVDTEVHSPSHQSNEMACEDESCVLDVGSGYVDTSNTLPMVIPPAKGYKKKSRPLSKRNDKSNYPVLPPCKCAKKKCSEKFPEEQRQVINDQFWALPNYNLRKQWLLEHIRRCDIKRRRVEYSQKPFRKTETRTYYLPDAEGDEHEVCKAFFLATLGYKWDSVIDTIHRTTALGDQQATPDRRGRKPPPHKIAEKTVVSMSKYIEGVCTTHRDLYRAKCLEAVESGKSGQTGNLTHYGLTMKQLFNDYKSKYQNHKFGYESFRKVFKHVYSNIVLSGSPTVMEPHSKTKSKRDSSHTTMSSQVPPEEFEKIEIDPVQGENHSDDQDTDEVMYPPYPPTLPYSSIPQNCLAESLSDPTHQSRPTTSADFSVNFRRMLPTAQHPGAQSLMVSEQGLHGCMFEQTAAEIGPHQATSKAVYQGLTQAYSSQHMLPHFGVSGPSESQPAKSNQSVGAVPHHFSPVTVGHQQDPQIRGLPKTSTPNMRPHDWHQAYNTVSPDPQYHCLLNRLSEPSVFPGHGGSYAGLQDRHPNPYDYHQYKQECYFRDSVHNDCLSLPQEFVPPIHLSGQNISTSVAHSHLNTSFTPQAHQSTSFTPYTNLFMPHGPMDNVDKFPQSTVKRDNLACFSGEAAVENNPPDKPVKQPKQKRRRLETGTKSGSSKKLPKNSLENPEKKRRRAKSARNFAVNYPMLPPCDCRKRKCKEHFPEERRQMIHDMFWSLGEYNDRKQWILLHMKRIDCKRRRVDQPETSRKLETRYYFLPTDSGETVEVCKDFFLRTLGYKWDSVIDTIRRTTPKGERVSKPDQRGKRTPPHKLSTAVTRSVVQYIKSMQQAAKLGELRPSDSSGQSRKKGAKQSINQQIPYGLTMKDLHNDYRAKHSDHKIGYESFRKIFKTTDFDAADAGDVDRTNYPSDTDIMLEPCP